MNAHMVFDVVPLGTIISYTDGRSRPPKRQAGELATWMAGNNIGRLSRKQAARWDGNRFHPADITIHWCEYSNGLVTMRPFTVSFAVDDPHEFKLIERPKVGSILVLARSDDNTELAHVADTRNDAAQWLERHPIHYRQVILHEVSADDVAADIVEGRVEK